MALSRRSSLIGVLGGALAVACIILISMHRSSQTGDVDAATNTLSSDGLTVTPVTTEMPYPSGTTSNVNIAEAPTNIAPIKTISDASRQSLNEPISHSASEAVLDYSIVGHPYYLSNQSKRAIDVCRNFASASRCLKLVALLSEFQSEPRDVQWATLAEDALFKFLESDRSDP
jgi:hypothetical protein